MTKCSPLCFNLMYFGLWPRQLQDRASRHVVRNVFMVQFEGTRKLRHLFLFNDVLVCAKCKTNGRTKYLEVKWFIPLNEVSMHREGILGSPDTTPLSRFFKCNFGNFYQNILPITYCRGTYTHNSM